MIIQRDFKRTEQDDFKINVEHYLTKSNEGVPICNSEGETLGWNIRDRYE